MATIPNSRRQLHLKDTLRCHLVSRDPLIITAYGNPMAAPTQLCPFLESRKVYFLLGNWWSFQDPTLLSQTKWLYQKMRESYPLHEFIFLANAKEECQLLEFAGLPHYLCHHNAFLDENIFYPMPKVEKTFDAIYTARLDPFKRHFLARKIPAWALVYYYGNADRKNQDAYFRALRQRMPNMVPLNEDPQTGQYRWFDPQAMCRAYNAARVGLCLSQLEGGNYATTEYMLCGLPVVSTPSQGGRDVFFDPEVTRVVPPDPRAVAEAVAELIALRIPPREVRLRALVKIREQREDFIRLVEALFAQSGRTDRFADQFDAVFTHKMLTYPGSPEKFLADHGLLADGTSFPLLPK